MASASAPLLPTLYFQDKGQPLSTKSLEGQPQQLQLPAELLQTTVSDYLSSWGELSKLSCVQKSWQTLVEDVAKSTPDREWNLACALWDGTDGLHVNTNAAIQKLYQIAAVPVHAQTHAPTTVNEINDDSNILKLNEYSAQAMKKLALWHLEKGVQQSDEEEEQHQQQQTGLAWLQCAFEMGGDSDAAHEMALIYEYARYGVKTDVVAAAHWFEVAANAGHVEAMAELGLCYELGCGVPASDETALDWYLRAANAGHVTAKFAVGEAFEEARGVPQSDEEACLWYYRAAMAGDEDSRKALKRLEDIARIVVPGVRALLFDV